jgi:hypothetical protein
LFQCSTCAFNYLALRRSAMSVAPDEIGGKKGRYKNFPL